jgi:L-ascorbate metabolism protein UlaG (beta-lactamase superfamily)
MKITKYGHACLLVEEGNARILIDPGIWNPTPDVTGVHAVLVTHEHQDHVDVGQLKEVLGKNPGASVITHEGVGKVLSEAGISYAVLEEGGVADVNGVSVQGVGHDHAIIYGDTSPCQNTGFLIDGRLFVPGDALHDIPDSQVEILALPTGAPWMKLAEAIDYAKAVKPKVVFPVHDAMYINDYQRGLVPMIIGGNLQATGIEFRDLPAGSSLEF